MCTKNLPLQISAIPTSFHPTVSLTLISQDNVSISVQAIALVQLTSLKQLFKSLRHLQRHRLAPELLEDKQLRVILTSSRRTANFGVVKMSLPIKELFLKEMKEMDLRAQEDTSLRVEGMLRTENVNRLMKKNRMRERVMTNLIRRYSLGKYKILFHRRNPPKACSKQMNSSSSSLKISRKPSSLYSVHRNDPLCQIRSGTTLLKARRSISMEFLATWSLSVLATDKLSNLAVWSLPSRMVPQLNASGHTEEWEMAWSRAREALELAFPHRKKNPESILNICTGNLAQPTPISMAVSSSITVPFVSVSPNPLAYSLQARTTSTIFLSCIHQQWVQAYILQGISNPNSLSLDRLNESSIQRPVAGSTLGPVLIPHLHAGTSMYTQYADKVITQWVKRNAARSSNETELVIYRTKPRFARDFLVV